VDQAADLLESGQPEEARDLSLRAIGIDPLCAFAWSNLAFAQLQLEELSAAVTSAQRAVEIDPMHATAWHNLGEAYLRMGDAEKSLTYNNRALTLNPDQPQYWLGKGTALMNLERFPEALSCLDRALALNPKHHGAKLNRDVAWLMADPLRKELFIIILGIAITHRDTPMDMASALEDLLNSANGILDRQMVLAFDSFSETNIALGKPVVPGFCVANRTLARLLRDPELERICDARLQECKAKFGIR